eukprot:CAMPEP_0197730096 /NCGR_PEP_ID=MMETSP1434-20131217/33187_1 /TAXON_ID=265543 /ORGANISM="Minutocellus polymorphus, Strain CCMP3303" /LENGTH=85 /DNA_ID=CAMNT_0043316857 /DNA_START=10 /DNA_END=268 /DNA_ORIENTATION=+
MAPCPARAKIFKNRRAVTRRGLGDGRRVKLKTQNASRGKVQVRKAAEAIMHVMSNCPRTQSAALPLLLLLGLRRSADAAVGAFHY